MYSRQDVSALSEEIEWDHICEYHGEHRKVDTKYADDTGGIGAKSEEQLQVSFVLTNDAACEVRLLALEFICS